MLWGWCGLYGAGCAALRAPYSLPHFYTYLLTSYLANCLDNVGHHANRVKKGSTPFLSSLGLEHSSSESKRPATGTKDHALRVGARVQQAQHFAHLPALPAFEPVVIDPRQMNRSAGHLEFSNILGAGRVKVYIRAKSAPAGATLFAPLSRATPMISKIS